MRKLFLTSLAALVVSGAFAQGTSFPDVPPDSYAADAVAELVELGILTGFPDGTFRGNEAFTRYQAALVVSRLLDVIEENVAAAGALSEEDLAAVNNAVQELSNQLGGFDERLTALEEAGAGTQQLTEQVGTLQNRIAALEEAGTGAVDPAQLSEQLSTLQNRITALEEAGEQAPEVDVTALQEQITALNAQVNELSAQLEAAQVPPEGEAEEPDVDVTEPLGAPEVVAVQPQRGKFYLGLGAAYELQDRVYPLVHVGVDDAVAGFGLRATGYYGRQTPITDGAVAVAGHLTYTLGVEVVSAYVGLGGGYQFEDLIFDTEATEGAFASALLGTEFGSGPITFFVEGIVDYYFTGEVADQLPGYDYDVIYPTVAAGINFRP